MNTIKLYFQNFLSGHERSVRAKKHILYSLVIKGISIVVGLAFVPLILNYLDAERYGIWLTLSSIIAWFSFFDVGLGKGLRNRLAEAIAKDQIKLARIYISTTYAILGIIFFIFLLIFIFINPLINWKQLLNTTIIEETELSKVAFIVVFFFTLSFFFKLIGDILLAFQRPAVNNSFGPLGNLLALIVIFILTKTTTGSLFYLALVLSSLPVFILIIATFYFFLNDYKKFAPSIKYVDFSKTKLLLGLGLKFFYLRIAVIIIYSSTNFLIAHFSDQVTVAAYNVSYKYFAIVYMIFTIILSPVWSATTDAYVRKDFAWIKNVLKKFNMLIVVFTVILFLLLLISPYIYDFWLGDKLKIKFHLSFLVSLYVLLLMINANYSAFINGFGKLKVSLITITLGLIIFVPLMYLLGKNYGVYGVLVAIILIQIPSLVIQPIQVYKIINNKANGFWNK